MRQERLEVSMTRSVRNARARDWKKWLDENPLKVIVAAVVAACGTTAGVLEYLHGEETKIDQKAATLKLDETKKQLTAQIEQLQTRLGGIERRIGDQSIWDVTSLTIPPNQVPKLSQNFISEDPFDVFISVPSGDPNWNFTKSSENGVLSMLIPAYSKLLAGSDLGNTLEKFPVLLWRARTEFQIGDGDAELRIFPYVSIEQVHNKDLFENIGKIIGEMDTFPGGEKGKEEAISKALEKKAVKDSVSDNVVKTTPTSKDLTEEKTEQTNTESSADSVTKFLSTAFNSDAASFFMLAQLVGIYNLTHGIPGSTSRILDAEKRGNVLYMHMQLIFPETEKHKRIYWDREVIVICTLKDSYLVQTSAPSVDQRPVEGPWITQWLAGLRVPLE